MRHLSKQLLWLVAVGVGLAHHQPLSAQAAPPPTDEPSIADPGEEDFVFGAPSEPDPFSDEQFGELADPRDPSIHVGIFGSVDLELYDPEDDQVVSVGLATLDIFFAARAWERVFAMVDVTFEEDQNDFTIFLDRYFIRYDWFQFFQLGIGQVHNPLIQWNRRVSHGLYLQTPATRPKFMDREVDEGIFPTHMLALTIDGTLLDSGFGYFVGVANGRGVELTQLQIREDANRHKAFVANLNYSPFSDGRLRLDATVYLDRIPDEVEPMDELDAALSLQYEDAHWEFRTEATMLNLSGTSSSLQSTVWGGYALLAYKFATGLGEIRPYVLGSYMLIDETFPTIPYFALSEITDDLTDYLAGIRWEPIVGVALKVEYAHSREGSDGTHEGAFQVGFAY